MKFPNLQLVKPDSIDTIVLEDLIDKYGGTIFHEKKLNELISSQSGNEFFYIVDDVHKPQIISPVHIEKKSLRTRFIFWPSFDIPYGGFIGNANYDFRLVKTGLNESYCYAGIPATKISHGQNDHLRHGLTLQETCMVDLSDNLETIFNHVINSKRRNMIRKAEKSGIIVKSFETVEASNDFFSLLGGLHNRLGYKILKPSYYLDLLNYYIPKNKAKLLVAFKDNNALSAVMLLGNKNFIHYYKGCSAGNTQNEGQGELLQWEAIKWAKSVGAAYYDLCGLSKEELPHLYLFKTGISAKIYYYSVYSETGLIFKVINKLDNLFNFKK
jgi:lipid II:glycine glycyltransferase (peptidoglycan interpeptide bridge formation enzyme)